MTDDRKKAQINVDKLLDAASSSSEPISPDLLARVLSDAERMQPRRQDVSQNSGPGLWEQLREALGGWTGLGGLATACCVGFWIGVNPPQSLPDAGIFLLGAAPADIYLEAVELSGFGWDIEEG